MKHVSALAAWYDPRGRLSRKAYGRLVIRLCLLAMAFLCLGIALGANGWWIGAYLAAAMVAGTCLVAIPQSIRRLHDRDRSGLWLAAYLLIQAVSAAPLEDGLDAYPVPVAAYAVLSLAFTVWFLIETFGRLGTDGPNRFGPSSSDRPRLSA